MSDQNFQERNKFSSEEIEKAYDQFVLNTAHRERFLMEIGLTRKTARLVLNLEFEAAKYPLEILLESEENFLRETNLKKFMSQHGCGCFGNAIDPRKIIEKYKKIFKVAIDDARINPITEIEYFIPKKTFWQNIQNLTDIEQLKALTSFEKFIVSRIDIFGLKKTDKPNIFKRILNLTFVGCTSGCLLFFILGLLSIISVGFIGIEEIETSNNNQSNQKEHINKKRVPVSNRLQIYDKAVECYTKLEQTTNDIINHPKMSLEIYEENLIKGHLSILKEQVSTIKNSCHYWGRSLCQDKVNNYYKVCQNNLNEQISLQDSLSDTSNW